MPSIFVRRKFGRKLLQLLRRHINRAGQVRELIIRGRQRFHQHKFVFAVDFLSYFIAADCLRKNTPAGGMPCAAGK